MHRVVHESLALNRSHDSLVNISVNDGYGREENGDDSDEAFSDWDSCDEPILVSVAGLSCCFYDTDRRTNIQTDRRTE